MTASTEDHHDKKPPAHAHKNGQTHVIPTTKVKVNDQDVVSVTSPSDTPEVPSNDEPTAEPEPELEPEPEMHHLDVSKEAEDDASSEIVRIENEAEIEDGGHLIRRRPHGFRRIVRTLQVSDVIARLVTLL